MTSLRDAAIAYAEAGWEVMPLRGKVPRIAGAHSDGGCKGECGRDGHGVLDATDDITRVAAWWNRWPTANIGGRVPVGCVVLDIDPRHGGLERWAELERGDGTTVTRVALSGRGDGGRHVYFHHPGGTLKTPSGIDVRVRGNYCVLPPSLHPDTGRPYTWLDPSMPIVDMPAPLVARLRPPRVEVRVRARRGCVGESIADWFSATHTLADVLEPRGWHPLNADGTRWLHPQATSELSATVRNDCLFVYTPNTAFEVTTASDPHGYTVFRAWAVLEYGGDLPEAARAARHLRNARAAL